ncbi:response regulator [Kineococcus sp. SYSU DK004]|uniref:response regulator n=1 Tax=Kineococcus sp. SYSU DK004 TaxID=3383125 RepID=UPI003D7CADA1
MGTEEPDEPGAGTVRVFLTDDHAVVRAGLRAVLESGGLQVVGEAGSVAEAVAGITMTRPDVAVLDGRLPDGSGVDVCRQVRVVSPATRTLVLTSYDDDEALLASVLAGASGYLLKEIRTTDLVASVRAVAAGESLLDPRAVEEVRRRLQDPLAADPRLAELTGQERRVLAALSEGLTNREIGRELHLAEKTVKNYVSSVLAKLGLASRTQAALFTTAHRPS